MRSKIAITALLTAALTLGPAANAADDAAAIVRYRQTIMKLLGSHMRALGAIAKHDVSYTKHVAAHAEGVRAMAQLLPELWPANTTPKEIRSGSKAEIWTKKAAFNQDAKDMATAAAKLAQLAKGKNTAAIEAQIGAVGKTCGDCHDAFRVEEKD
ncbi:MAG: cytochrome c [Acidobacteriota bacterium]|nr:cytochrome c [Acidobacteriota bacterium]